MDSIKWNHTASPSLSSCLESTSSLTPSTSSSYRLKSHPMPIFVFIIIAIGTEDRRHCICWKHVSHLYFGKGKELAKKLQQHESLWKAREWGVLLLDTPASELICQALVRLSWDCCRYNDHIVGLSPRKKCGEKTSLPPSVVARLIDG